MEEEDLGLTKHCLGLAGRDFISAHPLPYWSFRITTEGFLTPSHKAPLFKLDGLARGGFRGNIRVI